jgi:hypothetical protein
MKKLFVIFIIGFLLSGISLSTASTIEQNQEHLVQKFLPKTLNRDVIEGTFTGQFALKNESGYVILGTVEGSYNKTNYTGEFEGVWTLNEDDSTGTFQGWFWGSFFMGQIETTNGTDWFAGLSMVNETDNSYSAIILALDENYDYYIRYSAGTYEETDL